MAGRRAKKIKEFREFLRMNQEEFGDLFGQAQSTISIWEDEKSQVAIKLSTARVILRHAQEKGFSLTIDDIYGDVDADA